MQQSFRHLLTTTVKDLLQRLGFEAEVQTSEEAIGDEGKIHYRCDITLHDGQNLLIGQHGANIGALLHVVRLAVRKEIPEKAMISLDVNQYFQEKQSFLEHEALSAAREVEETGLPVALRPMLSFERKMVHHLLSSHPSVVTESVGNGEGRKVLVKRKPEPMTEEFPSI